MNNATIKRLNDINRAFYRITAKAFDQSRSQPWPGWETLLPHLHPPLSVLDVGCGNGRFGAFLAEHLSADIAYTGVDNNPALLERARAAVTVSSVQFEQRDIVEHPLDTGTYDLVALFGVIHHIPGSAQRQDFMRTLAERVAQSGLLVFAAWRFYDFERFRKRIVPWSETDISPDEVEPHDYLLDWRRGERALRYCHFVDDDEHAVLTAATGLTEIATYRADGQAGTVNRYSLLQRNANRDTNA